MLNIDMLGTDNAATGHHWRDMISIEEIPAERINEFWEIHIKYLVDDGFIADEEDIVDLFG